MSSYVPMEKQRDKAFEKTERERGLSFAKSWDTFRKSMKFKELIKKLKEPQ